MGFLEDMASDIIRSRMVIPSKDMPMVCADTAKYTDDGEPLREDQVHACDLAIIDYILHRLVKQATPTAHSVASNIFPPAVKQAVQAAATSPLVQGIVKAAEESK